MPQPKPNPWFFMMLTSWLIFSLIIPSKLLSFSPTNPPSNKTYMTAKATPWAWQWT